MNLVLIMNIAQLITILLNTNESYKSMEILKNFKRPYNLRGKPRNFDYDGTMNEHLNKALNSKILKYEWDILEHSSCIYERALYKKWQKNPEFKCAFKSEFIDIIFNYLLNNNVINNEYKNCSGFINVINKKLNEFKDHDIDNKAKWDLYQKLMVLQLI